jgi:hypothetical protein
MPHADRLTIGGGVGHRKTELDAGWAVGSSENGCFRRRRKRKSSFTVSMYVSVYFIVSYKLQTRDERVSIQRGEVVLVRVVRGLRIGGIGCRHRLQHGGGIDDVAGKRPGGVVAKPSWEQRI